MASEWLQHHIGLFKKQQLHTSCPAGAHCTLAKLYSSSTLRLQPYLPSLSTGVYGSTGVCAWEQAQRKQWELQQGGEKQFGHHGTTEDGRKEADGLRP